MFEETLIERETTLVRRMRLEPGEAMAWHRDPFDRVSVVVSGDLLDIEYRDGGPPETFEVAPGQAGWDEPTERVHRGVNAGEEPYEEITVFFLDDPDAIPQPK
ncbi:MAG: hypothetical protein ACRDSJ_11315, partial [Rubrobacteraceae bacterium]